MDKSDYDPERWTRTSSEAVAFSINAIFARVYGWMFAGLTISGLTAWQVAGSPERLVGIAQNYTILIILEFALVFGITFGMKKLAPQILTVLFLVFSFVNGLTLSFIFLAYELGTIQNAFFISAGMFAGLAIFGTVTKMRLDGIGAFCSMALWGIIIATIVNMFVKLSGFDLIVSYAAVAVFIGLTAWDAQKIRNLARESHLMTRSEIAKIGIIGALSLYLDFINLFLYILRLLGGRKGND